jgi:flagellar basal-body rod protein FlgB
MLQDVTGITLKKTLDATALRHRTLANNIANVETPEYRRQNVSFEADLRDALSAPEFLLSAKENTIQQVSPQIQADNTHPVGENGNNVNIDEEMAELAENTLRYEAILRALSIKGGMLQSAIYEGKR